MKITDFVELVGRYKDTERIGIQGLSSGAYFVRVGNQFKSFVKR